MRFEFDPDRAAITAPLDRKQIFMRAEFDFSGGKRQALIGSKGKTRISVFIDNAVLEAFRARAEAEGTGYQTMMNDALKQYLLELVSKPS